MLPPAVTVFHLHNYLYSISLPCVLARSQPSKTARPGIALTPERTRAASHVEEDGVRITSTSGLAPPVLGLAGASGGPSGGNGRLTSALR